LGLLAQVGQPSPSETPNYPALQNAYSHHGFEGQYEQRHPFDTQQNWVHGYFQEIPAYGGHTFFRPYNYKDVLSQSQTAAGWGLSPTMPYSQQFWHRYQDQATMLKLSQQSTPPSTLPQVTMSTPAMYLPQPVAMPQTMMMAQPVMLPQGMTPQGMMVPAGAVSPAGWMTPQGYAVPAVPTWPAPGPWTTAPLTTPPLTTP
jgi:hypothetical protein